MRKYLIVVLAAMSLLLSGCGLIDGSYVSVTPHQEQRMTSQSQVISAADYQDLMKALIEMIHAGTETSTINVSAYPQKAVESGMAVAIRNVMENDPLGAYAVQDIYYEVGYSGGQPAVAVEITYLHNRTEIRRIKHVEDMEDVSFAVSKALEEHVAGVVLLVSEYTNLDFHQLVQDYAAANPHLIMETPQVVEGVFGNGRERLIALNFNYQNSRDALRQMQNQVRPIFESAVLYVSADASHWQKYSQLYSFLMERFDYIQETSITPAYSLLHHGVGDSKAFATVYAAMCRAAGLECRVVTGTRYGMPWTWNMVKDNGTFYHVDLLRCNESNHFLELTDSQMQGYVWDYSAHPVSIAPAVPSVPQESEQATEPEKLPESEPVPIPEETEN